MVSIIISIISLLGTIAIAVATGFYTKYSARTINELKKQNELSTRAINTSLDIENKKIESKRRSLAKNLLFEVQDNNYALDDSNFFFHTKLDLIKKAPNIFNVVDVNFSDVIYKIYLENSIDVDFNCRRLNLLLRDYYKKINKISEHMDYYNKVWIGEKFELKKRLFMLIRSAIDEIKKQNLGSNLLDLLQGESGFNLKKEGFLKELSWGRKRLIKVVEILRGKNN